MKSNDFLDEESRRSTVNCQRSTVDGQRSIDDSYDEPLDETLMAHAHDYNAPGEVPREAMWEAIAGRTGRTGRAGRASRASEEQVLVFRRAVRVMLPIAAVLVVGILIGRMGSDGSRRSRVEGRESPSVIARPQSGRSNPVARTDLSGDPIASSAPLGDAGVAPTVAAPPRNDTAARVPRPSTRVPQPATVDRPSTAFSIAAERHFAQAESFLTLFRASVREGKSESLAPATARELLVSNRLLMDSPAANDPKVSHLLDDIELVLAQIAQMPAEGRQADAKIITDGLEAGGVLTRIRSEVTSGPVAAVPQGVL
jgi:hypothetical protein